LLSPLALDEQGHVLVVFRLPARLAVFQPQDGQLINAVATCGDSDDVFADHKHHRVYVSCGEGFVDVFAVQGNSYARISHIATVSGARTALFVPEIDRLFLAVRASGGAPASSIYMGVPPHRVSLFQVLLPIDTSRRVRNGSGRPSCERVGAVVQMQRPKLQHILRIALYKCREAGKAILVGEREL
jgi:hypothetical protein